MIGKTNLLITKACKLSKLPLGIFPVDKFGNKELYSFLALKINGSITSVYWKLPGRERVRIIQDLDFHMRITMKKFHIRPPY